VIRVKPVKNYFIKMLTESAIDNSIILSLFTAAENRMKFFTIIRLEISTFFLKQRFLIIISSGVDKFFRAKFFFVLLKFHLEFCVNIKIYY
jgi:hypothetical protein